MSSPKPAMNITWCPCFPKEGSSTEFCRTGAPRRPPGSLLTSQSSHLTPDPDCCHHPDTNHPLLSPAQPAKGQSPIVFTLPENSEPGQLLSVLRLVDGHCPLTKLCSGSLQALCIGSLPSEEQKPQRVALQANEVHAGKSIGAIELFQGPVMLL